MAAYRIYLLGPGDRFMNGQDAECPDDSAAFEHARATLQPGERAEIWQGTRCLGQVTADAVPVRAASEG